MRWRLNSAAALLALMLASAAGAQPVLASYGAAAPSTNCWQMAGTRYQISPWLLYAIAQAESDLNPRAVNRSHVQRTGTYDIGLMQINSSHLAPGRPLTKAGWAERDLFDPCKNIFIGAWLLAENIRRMGPKWDAVGAYNAVCVQLKGEACVAARRKYIHRVWTRLTRSAHVSAQQHQTAVQPVVEEPPLPLRIGGRG